MLLTSHTHIYTHKHTNVAIFETEALHLHTHTHTFAMNLHLRSLMGNERPESLTSFLTSAKCLSACLRTLTPLHPTRAKVLHTATALQKGTGVGMPQLLLEKTSRILQNM